MRHCMSLAGVLLCIQALPAQTTPGLLIASLDTGALAGTRFPVAFSYDAGQVFAQGDSYITLLSFDFILRGVTFTRNDIFQGGQAIFHNGKLTDVTASFQVRMPPGAPLNNITFGFGGDGVIGYIDLQNNYGSGSFVFTTASAVVNAASFAANQPLAPGSLASIFGAGLAVSTAQADVSVMIGGLPAPLQYVSPSQINLQIPWELPAGTTGVRITTNGFALPALQISITPYAPAIFVATPAKPGDYTTIWATGLGPVTSSDGLRTTLTTPQVLIGGLPAQVTFSGLSPQFVGVNQINAIVPPVAAGPQPLQLEIGGVGATTQIIVGGP